MTYNRSELATAQTLQDLTEVRDSMLVLHTLLLGFERASYEANFGRMTSGEMLKLVIDHEQFAWLHVISQIVVRIDEMLDAEEPVTVAAALSVVNYSIDTLQPTESRPAFREKYLSALQEDPDIIFAHRETQQILFRARTNVSSGTSPQRRATH